MQQMILLGILFGGIILLGVVQGNQPNVQRDICYFPKRFKYPCEIHRIRTADGYILSTARIPYSIKGRKRARNRKRPVVFLMHGIIWSSDCWLLTDPHNGLAYMLADAGYDVWIGNARGNIYSKNHVSKSALSSSFWEFSWHEIGVYDLPATINYILSKTKQRNLHYVGHSQGTTVFLVWLATYPRDTLKIKTSHLLAPVGFIDHLPLAIAGTAAAILGQPSPWINNIPAKEILGRSTLFDALPPICNDIRDLCYDIFLFISRHSNRINRTLVPDVLSTFPSGSSSRQVIHYLQEYSSGHFRQYDYGVEQNIRVYSNVTPPNYRVDRIKTSSAINLYYGDSDIFVSPIDVHRLAQIMRHTIELHPILTRGFNHMDFLLALDTKEVINDCVMAKMERYEGKPFKRNACCHVSSNCVRSG